METIAMVMGWVCAMAIRSLKAIPSPNETLLGNSQVIETESAAPSRECHSTSHSVFERRIYSFYLAPESSFFEIVQTKPNLIQDSYTYISKHHYMYMYMCNRHLFAIVNELKI